MEGWVTARERRLRESGLPGEGTGHLAKTLESKQCSEGVSGIWTPGSNAR